METLESRLSTIDRAIADRQAALESIDALAPQRSRAQRRSAVLLRYLQLAALLRKPTSAFGLWPIGVLAIGPFAAGVVCLIFFVAFAIPSDMAPIPLAATYLLSAAAFASLLYLPPGPALPQLLEKADLRYHACRAESLQIEARRDELTRDLGELRRERDGIHQSIAYQREQLLTRNWKAMRDSEWEAFLCDAFRALGGQVETTPTSGDQGVDLIVTLDGRRIAVQAKGYFNAVGNGAVQEAVAGKAHYRCEACAVITNSRFTRLARALAESNACRLIDEGSVPAFVRGELPL